ncbi:MAG: hypothetical protein ABIE70_03345 [bacterium]
MTTRTKTIMALGATLVIGMAIGVMGSGAIMGRLVDRYEREPVDIRAERFVNHMQRVLNLDDSLRVAVDPILRSHAARMTEMNQRHRTEMEADMDSFQTELSTVLTPAQMEPLKNMRRFGRGRPPDGGFGGGRSGGKRGRP